ncbi:MAG: glycosyltransferase family 2 protein [Planctomycetota bacterium]|nr:glycosyltransferase family 2 protein [Planctomycetota bacterium]MDI6787204.1 glycosyltransferase family 2 protein [Planctomycetota bacterium]
MRNVCAVIVSYNPEDYLIPNVMVIRPQVDEVIIIDNGSSEKSLHILDTVSKIEGVKVIYNNDNLGISAALNIGIKYAMNADYSWVATFDQDSKVAPEFISSMLSAYELCEYKNSVAIIFPIYYNPVTGRRLSFGSDGTPMTSGNLLPTYIFPKVGLFDEDFFIDYVDVEFCLRCLFHGFRTIEAQNAILYHASGKPTQHRFLWEDILVTHHSPLRGYYGARNRVVLWKRYFLVEPYWVKQDIINMVRHILKIVLYEKDVIKKLFSILKGTYHGFVGKTGKYK